MHSALALSSRRAFNLNSNVLGLRYSQWLITTLNSNTDMNGKARWLLVQDIHLIRYFHGAVRLVPKPIQRSAQAPLSFRRPTATEAQWVPTNVSCQQQQRRTFLDLYRRRVQYERETGNWANLRIPVISAIVTTTVGLLLIAYGYITYQEWSARTLHNYPPLVAKKLRRALYFSRNPGSSSYDPKEAIRYFVDALGCAREEGMHPLSPEVTGIKIEIARVCEECGRKDKAVDVLREVWESLGHGLGLWDSRTQEGEGEGVAIVTGKPREAGKEGKETQKDISKEKNEQGQIPDTTATQLSPAQLELQRTALARRFIETGVKLGTLLLEGWPEAQVQPRGEVVEEKQRKEEGEKVLESAVTRILAEQRRRHEWSRSGNLKKISALTGDDRGSWFSPADIASAFEILARHYLDTSRPHLAQPLLTEAIHALFDCADDQTRVCHSATLMNNIAAALSEIPTPTRTSTTPPLPTQTPEYWINLALRVTTPPTPGEKPPPPPGLSPALKSEECIHARITAMTNLAELRLQQGNVPAARKAFEEVRKEARDKRWQEGVARAEEGVRRCEEVLAAHH